MKTRTEGRETIKRILLISMVCEQDHKSIVEDIGEQQKVTKAQSGKTRTWLEQKQWRQYQSG